MLRLRSNWMRTAVEPSEARRGHLRDAGDLCELALQRLRHRGRHGFRAAAGQARGNLDGREVDLRQGRHGATGDRRPARMNRIPAISSEVPIGKRMNGEEMLSFMPRSGAGWRIFSRKPEPARWRGHGCAFPSKPLLRRLDRMRIRPRQLAGSILTRPVAARTEISMNSFNLRPTTSSSGDRRSREDLTNSCFNRSA